MSDRRHLAHLDMLGYQSGNPELARQAREEARRVLDFIEADNGRGGGYKRLWIAERLCRLVLAAAGDQQDNQ